MNNQQSQMSPMSCPNCRRVDNVRKVSAIVSAETSSGIYTGYGDGVGYTSNGMVIMDEMITLSGSSQTTLSRLLSPPIQPGYQSAWNNLLFFFTIVMGFVFVLSLYHISGDLQELTNPTYAGIFSQAISDLIVWGMILAIGVCVLAWICRGVGRTNTLNYQQSEAQMPHWHRAISKWQRLFYCCRCDGVFLPGQSFLVPTISMMDFLYKP